MALIKPSITVFVMMIIIIDSLHGQISDSIVSKRFDIISKSYRKDKQKGLQDMKALVEDCKHAKIYTNDALLASYYLGYYYFDQEYISPALDEYRYVISKDPDTELTPRVYAEIGNVLRGQGDDVQAHEMYLSAVSHPSFSCKRRLRFYQELVETSLDIANRAHEAKVYLDSAFVLYKRCGGDRAQILYDIYNLGGEIYTGTKDYDTALKYYAQAAQQIKKIKNPNARHFFNYNNIGTAHLNSGDFKKALYNYQLASKYNSLEITERNLSSLGMLNRNLARAYNRLDQGDYATKLLKTFSDSINQSRYEISRNLLIEENIQNLHLITHIYRRNTTEKIPKEYFESADELHAFFQEYQDNLTYDKSKSQALTLRGAFYDDLIVALLEDRQWDKALYYIEWIKYNLIQDYAHSPEGIYNISVLSDSLDTDEKIEVIHQLYNTIKQNTGSKDQELSLDPEIQHISFYQDDFHNWHRLIVFNHNIDYKKLGSGKEIDEKINEFGNLIRDKLSCEDVAKDLFKSLLIDAQLQSSFVISAHKALNKLPFAALVDEDGHFLVENHIVYYCKSFLLDSLTYDGHPLVIDCVLPDLSKWNQYKPLTGADDEVRFLKENYQCEVYTNEANQNHLNQQLVRSDGILHLATHAIVDTSNSYDFLLLLADSTSYKAPDILRSVSNRPMVTIATCSSGDGKLMDSEGLQGMSYIFSLAGNHNQLLSLWSLDDLSGSRIIQLFYDLLESQSAESALTTAQRKYLSESPKYLRHPFYWASLKYEGFPVDLNIATAQKWNLRYAYIFGLLILMLLLSWRAIR